MTLVDPAARKLTTHTDITTATACQNNDMSHSLTAGETSSSDRARRIRHRYSGRCCQTLSIRLTMSVT